MTRSGRRSPMPRCAANCSRTSWLMKAHFRPSAVACRAKRWHARPASTQCILSFRSETKTATGGTPDLSQIFFIFAAGGDHVLHEDLGEPARHGRTARRAREQPVHGGNSFGFVEAQPSQQLIHEGLVVHLGRVAPDHIVAEASDLRPFGHDPDRHADGGAGLFEKPQVLVCHRLPS